MQISFSPESVTFYWMKSFDVTVIFSALLEKKNYIQHMEYSL